MNISVLDPGLRNATGHHMALLEHFAAHLSAKDNVDYYCSSSFDLEHHFNVKLTSNISVIPTFLSKFYQNYNQDLKYTDANTYVLTLADEYYQAISSAGDGSKNVNILLPTLLWEHALAFDQALKRYKVCSPDTQLNVVALLMFNPASFETVGNGRLKLNFSMAFQALAKHSEIQFFAGDQEALDEYRLILGHSRDISIHPCFLISHPNKPNKRSRTYIIGYLGDAKREKGFLDTPELIDRFVASRNTHTLLIHYTMESDDSEYRAVERRLTAKATLRDNIEIVKGYVSEPKMRDYLANSVQVILNYSETEYKNKTSGIIWLAARYAIAVTCSKNTWMWREYKRLTELEYVSNTSTGTKPGVNQDLTNPYAQNIFAPFMPWLCSRFIVNKALQ